MFGYRCAIPSATAWSSSTTTGRAVGLEEKPARAALATGRSPASTSTTSDVVDIAARRCKPSARGELEITDLNRVYLRAGELRVERLGRGYRLARHRHATRPLLQAANFIQTIEERQGLQDRLPEEIAYRLGFIDAEDPLGRLADAVGSSVYRDYLKQLARDPRSI